MAAHDRLARVWLPSTGRHLARAGSSGAVCRSRRSRPARSPARPGMHFRLGNEPAKNAAGNPQISRALEASFPHAPMKKVLLTSAQVAVTIALLYFVFRDPAKRAQMATALRLANYWWMALGIAAYLTVELAAAIRWQVLLRVQKIHLSNMRVGGLFLIGMFYNQFMPGGTGGDIIKSYLLLKETPDKKAGALLAVLFDRLIGLMALISIT